VSRSVAQPNPDRDSKPYGDRYAKRDTDPNPYSEPHTNGHAIVLNEPLPNTHAIVLNEPLPNTHAVAFNEPHPYGVAHAHSVAYGKSKPHADRQRRPDGNSDR
jgi:hypothetical protein